jgi:PAS domain S-box-containing protein
MKDKGINFFTLRFLDEVLERDFSSDYFTKSLKHVRLAMAFGLFLYAVFGILDSYIIPEEKSLAWFIRYAVVCPYFVFLLLFSLTPQFKRFIQESLVVLVIIAGAGITIMIIKADQLGSHLYSSGLMLVYMFSYSFLKMRFVHATVASLAVLAAYEVAALSADRISFPVILGHNFFYISANLVGMFTAYHLEFYARRDFLQTLLVKEQEETKYRSETEQMQALVERTETALQQSEAKFGMLAEIAPVAIFIHQGSHFIYANPAGAAITGYSREELFAMDFSSLIHPDFRDLVRGRAFARLQGEQPPSNYELKYITKTGEERWAYMNAGVIDYEGAPAVIGTLFDITELKRAEEETARLHEDNIRQYQARMEDEKHYQAEKEKILKDLHDGVGGATMNMNLLAELALRESSLPAIKKALATISELGRENLSEIQRFLYSLDAAKTNWHIFTSDMRHYGSTMIEPHGMTFDLEATAGNREGQFDSLLSLNLFRIYKEALSNIVKHSRAKAVTVVLTVGRDNILLTIHDDGIGLDSRNESGRGLKHMRARAEEMGGRLTVSSDQGTTVRLDLPLRQKYAGRSIEDRQMP